VYEFGGVGAWKLEFDRLCELGVVPLCRGFAGSFGLAEFWCVGASLALVAPVEGKRHVDVLFGSIQCVCCLKAVLPRGTVRLFFDVCSSSLRSLRGRRRGCVVRRSWLVSLGALC